MKEKLFARGFILLESSTSTYGNGRMTGSIAEEKGVEVFYPFIKADDDKKPNLNFQSVRLETDEQLDNYIK